MSAFRVAPVSSFTFCWDNVYKCVVMVFVCSASRSVTVQQVRFCPVTESRSEMRTGLPSVLCQIETSRRQKRMAEN